jgi:DNA-binding HxlR family transcriptional regulator
MISIYPIEGKRNGRPPEKGKRKYKVVDFIPEDGTSIRFKDLETKCKDHTISHRILLKDLERLQEAGIIVKDAVKTERGAGTQYRRRAAPQTPLPTAMYSLFEKAMESAENIKDKGEREKETMRAIYGLYVMINTSVLAELVEYTLTYDEEKAEKRLDSALEDIIVPLIKEAVRHAPRPVKYTKQAMSSLFNATKFGFEEWNRVWNLPATHDGHRTDDKKTKGGEKD